MSHYRNMRLDLIRRVEEGLRQIDKNGQPNDFRIASNLLDDLRPSQTVIFSDEQANVFWGISKSYTDSLEYLLPFPRTFLQLSRPDPVMFNDTIYRLVGLMLEQKEVSEGLPDDLAIFDENDSSFEEVRLKDLGQPLFFNSVYAITFDEQDDLVVFENSWFSGVHMHFQTHDSAILTSITSLAIACIGYINCENVYLERESVPEKVNEKRERKGKSRLEPYYICRIRGVQYNGAEETGNGAKHGIRYDVRGHFRRLQTGKTIWVRPHQRGLQNELYVPKTYLVDRRTA